MSELEIIQKRLQILTTFRQQSRKDTENYLSTMDHYPAQHLEGLFISMDDLNAVDDFSTVDDKKLYTFDNGNTVIEQSTHDNQ